MNIKDKLIQATSIYFDDELDYLQLSQATKSYKEILDGLCSKEYNNDDGRENIGSKKGKAIGSLWAALCLEDLIRTRQFLRGIDKAIKDKLKTKNKLNIVYAGTGPFATLVLPFLLRYSKDKIQYTFLEINPLSFEILNDLLNQLGLNDNNIKMVQEDATNYQIKGNTPDIIISETMQNALANEPQVSIFQNLVNQGDSETIFIPENIEIYYAGKAANIPAETLSRKDYIKIEDILSVSKKTIFPNNQYSQPNVLDYSFKIPDFSIDKERLIGQDHMYLITEIQVYKDEKIQMTESSLTTPIPIYNLDNQDYKSLTIKTEYVINDQPKLKYSITRVIG